jgi:hypothetical protein
MNRTPLFYTRVVNFLLLATLAIGAMDAASQPSPATSSSIQRLAPLVGVWETSDTYHPVSGPPSVENAVRTCEFVMRESYLQCETVVTRAGGGGRTYRFLINHNPEFNRFEMISIWSNVRHKLVQALVPDDDHRRWRFSNLDVIGLKEPPTASRSELVIESPERITWTGWRLKSGDDTAASLSFVESWVRRK